jgi:hypothetical protein
MKYLIIIAILITSISCVKKDDKQGNLFGETIINPEFKKYVAKFLADGKNYGKTFDTSKLSIVFNPSLSGGSILAQCSIDPNHPERVQKIEVNPTFWTARRSIEAKEYIIYHELGHCLLLRDHDNSQVQTTEGILINKSIMASYYSTTTNYLNNYNLYLKELYSKTLPTVAYTAINTNHSDFPANYYAMALTNVKSYKVVVNNESDNDITDSYDDISNFGCEE